MHGNLQLHFKCDSEAAKVCEQTTLCLSKQVHCLVRSPAPFLHVSKTKRSPKATQCSLPRSMKCNNTKNLLNRNNLHRRAYHDGRSQRRSLAVTRHTIAFGTQTRTQQTANCKEAHVLGLLGCVHVHLYMRVYYDRSGWGVRDQQRCTLQTNSSRT